MKTVRAWHLGIRDIIIMFGSRQRSHLKRPTWIIGLVSMVSIFLIGAFVYPPRSSVACYLFSSSGCPMFEQHPYVPSRELTDDETAARVVFREILKTPPIQSKNPKIAFMFLTPGPLPFEKLWDKFFRVRLCSVLIIFCFVLLLALFMHIVPEFVFSISIGCALSLCLRFYRVVYATFFFLIKKNSSVWRDSCSPHGKNSSCCMDFQFHFSC